MFMRIVSSPSAANIQVSSRISRSRQTRSPPHSLAELGPGWIVVDLREAVPGLGIAWGRYGPRTELCRHGDLQLFAYREPAKRGGLFSRRRGR